MPKAKKPVNVTAKSVEYYRERGYIVENVEHWKEFPDKKKGRCPTCQRGSNIKIRADLWEFADLLAIKPRGPQFAPPGIGGDIVLVQVTTRDHQANRKTKILGIPEAKICLAAGIRIEVHGWGKLGAQGKRKLWQVAISEVKYEDFPESMATVRPNDSSGRNVVPGSTGDPALDSAITSYLDGRSDVEEPEPQTLALDDNDNDDGLDPLPDW